MGFPRARVAGTVAAAACCAATLYQHASLEFERVRVGLAAADVAATASQVEIALPSLASLPRAGSVLSVDLRNDAPTIRTITASLDNHALGEVILQPGVTGRLNAPVPAAIALEEPRTLRLLGNGDLWVVRRAEMTNFRGFSTGLFNFVIVPESVQDHHGPSLAVSLIASIVLLMIGLLEVRWRSRDATLSLIASSTAYAVIAVVWLFPLVSPYRALLALHTWLLVCALLHLPVIERLSTPLARPAAAAAIRLLVAARAATRQQAAPSIANRDLVVGYVLALL